MAWVEQSQFNLGEVSPGASIKPNSAAALAGLKEFKNGLVGYDNVIEKRMGTTDFPLAGVPFTKRIAFSFSPKKRQFQIILVADDSLAIPQSRIYVIEKVAGTWVPFRIDAFIIISAEPSTEFREAPGTSTEWAPHAYNEAELDNVQFVEYNDRCYLLHEDHMPLLLQLGQSGFHVLAPFDAWKWSVSDFGGGPELAGRRNPVLFTLSTRSEAGFGRCTASFPIFRGNQAPVRVPVTVGALSTLGAIWRIGGSKHAEEEDHAKFGQFFMVERYLGASTVDLKKIDTSFAPTVSVDPDLVAVGRFEDKSEPNDWAGPWIDTGSDVSLNLTTPLANGSKFTFNTAASGKEDIGHILAQQNATTGVISACFLVVTATDTTTTIANVGPPIAIATNFTILHRFKPASQSGMAIMSDENVSGSDIVQNEVHLTFYEQDGLPEGHETKFESVKFGRDGLGASIVVGGVVFINDGIFRVTDVRPATSGSNDAAKGWTGYWQREPTSAAPSSSWGYGWSKGTGFPSVGVVHQQRLVLAGFKSPASALVASAPLRPSDMNALEFAGQSDAPLNLELTSGDDSEQIRWLASANRHLQLGTDKGEYSLRGVPLSLESIGLEPHSKYGGGLRAGGVASVGPTSAFIAEGGLVVREMQAEADTGQFVSPNVLSLATHILAAGETYDQIVGVNHRFPLYAIRTSLGRVIFLTRDHENEIVAPSPVENDLVTGGGTKVCQHIWRAQGENGYDVIWSTWRYDTPVSSEWRMMYYEFDRYGDSFTTVPAATYNTIQLNVKSWLRGTKIQVTWDGIYWGEFDVPNNSNVVPMVPEFPDTTKVVTYGESVTFKATPTVKDVSGPGGTTLAQQRQVNNMRLFLVDSIGGNVVEDNTSQISPMNTTLAAPTVANGWVDVPGVGVNGRDPSPSVQSKYPFPFRVSAIAMEVSMK